LSQTKNVAVPPLSFSPGFKREHRNFNDLLCGFTLKLRQKTINDAVAPSNLTDLLQAEARRTGRRGLIKRRVVYDTGHDIPSIEMIKETLDWLDRYLGPVSEFRNIGDLK
jgi:hypothetical protein